MKASFCIPMLFLCYGLLLKSRQLPNTSLAHGMPYYVVLFWNFVMLLGTNIFFRNCNHAKYSICYMSQIGAYNKTNQSLQTKLVQSDEAMLPNLKLEIYLLFIDFSDTCRKVRHKNVVQFIGACTKPPSLCIVTGKLSISVQSSNC